METTKKAPVKKTPAPKKEAPVKAAAPAHASSGKLAVIQIRGVINAKNDIIATMEKMLLKQKLACYVMPDTDANRMALQKVKDYTTFGTITEETHKLLIEKRGEKDSEGKIKRYFRLHPPRGGFEKKGVKIPFGLGGALGNRKDKMNDLIKKML